MNNRILDILKHKYLIYIVFAVLGLILILMSYIISSKDIQKREAIPEQDYGYKLERKIEEMLCEVTGEGSSKVMITFKGGNQNVTEELKNKNAFASFSTTDTSTSNTSQYPEIAGVMVVCNTISTAEDFLNIKKAISTVLDISSDQIYIIGGTDK